MTEYDFSPEALDAYIQKQNKIAHWARETSRSPVSDPFTPATPHVRALNLAKGNTPYPREQAHTRRPSYDYPSREPPRTRDFDKDFKERDRKERERERDRGDRYHHERRDRERERERERSYERTSDSRRDDRTPTRRHRSASHSALPQPTTTTTRPDHQRSRVPAPLVLPNYPYYPSSKQTSPTSWTHPPAYVVPIGPSPRDSKHSSQSSSATLFQPSPTSYFPPYSAPPAPGAPYKPTRTMTHPQHYPRQQQDYYYNQPPPLPPFKPYTMDPSSAPQLHQATGYAQKPQPLLKRIFMGLTGGGSKHSQTSSSSQRTLRRKRSSSL